MKLLILILFLSSNVVASVKVSVSIKPIHSIVALLTQGLTVPDLLIDDNQTAHHFFMRPSHARKITNSDLVVLVDKNFEKGFQKIISNLDNRKIFYFSDASKRIINSKYDEHDEEILNPHLWLDRENVVNFAKILSNKLMEIDPVNKKQLQKNLDLFLKKFSEVSRINLSNEDKKIVILQSNSAEYFLNDNNIKHFQIISNNHEEHISMKKYNEIIKLSEGNKIACVVVDDKSNSDVLKNLAKELNTQLVFVDIVSHDTKDFYEFFQSISERFSTCLQ
ncbi:MAG: metal ABC transporter substrate-binding protein [Gammaproteobacteria bacterium]